VAPFYYRWPVEVGVVDDSRRVCATTGTDWDLTGIMPGATATEFEARVPMPATTRGRLRVLLRAANALPTGLPLRFANQTQDADQPGWITLGELNR
jgi:hypothetical protein